jgi:hypothetical protein
LWSGKESGPDRSEFRRLFRGRVGNQIWIGSDTGDTSAIGSEIRPRLLGNHFNLIFGSQFEWVFGQEFINIEKINLKSIDISSLGSCLEFYAKPKMDAIIYRGACVVSCCVAQQGAA